MEKIPSYAANRAWQGTTGEPTLTASDWAEAYAAYRGLLQLAHEAPVALPTDWSFYADVSRNALIPPGIPKQVANRRASRRRGKA